MWLVLSFSLATSIHWFAQCIKCCEATNATATMLRLLLLYQFWLVESCICHQPCPTRDETRNLQIALPRTFILLFFFFYTSDTPHTRHICAHFELWSRPFCSSLLASFFLPFGIAIPYSFFVTFHFSHSSSSPPVFYPVADGCWIHVNVGCSACIYSMPLVSLNDKSRLAHRRQQSVGSAFQFQFMKASSGFFF